VLVAMAMTKYSDRLFQEVCVNGFSYHNLLFNLVLPRLLGVHHILLNLDPGTLLHCHAVNGSCLIPSSRSQKFGTNTVFMLAKLSTPLTVHTRSLHSTLKKNSNNNISANHI